MRKNNIFKKNPLFESCPKCGNNGKLRKSHAKNLKETLVDNLTYYKMYRCRECGWRGFLSTFNFSAITAKLVLLYLSVVVILSYFVLIILSKVVH